MSQNDFNLANQGFPSMRADMNSAFQALATNSSGATAPSTTYSYQWWYDTANDILKQRNAGNDAWISVASYNQTTDQWFPFVGATEIAGLATEIQAEVGTATNVLMTPLSTRQAFNVTGSAPVYACRAWVNFIGTGTVSIRASGNVSSITDNGTGSYTVNFTTTMPDANYAVNATTLYRGSGSIEAASVTNPFAGAVQILIGEIGAGTGVDVPGVFVSVFR